MKKRKSDKRRQSIISKQRAYSDRHFKEWKKKSRRILISVTKNNRKNELERARKKLKKEQLNKICAPVNFSFNKNTNEVIEFISKIEILYKNGKGVYVDLRRVEYIDYGSIVSLLSILIQFRRKRININGNFPVDKGCEKILRESGFIYNLFSNKMDNERYCIENGGHNSITTYGWKKVDTALSAKIIQESSMTIWHDERRCQGVQRCIGELMLNTNNHARPGHKGALNWWLYVNHDAERKIVSFAFVDFGIGIFESLKNKPSDSKFFGWIEKVKNKIFNVDNGKILKMIMSGEFHSTVTGKYYRGKGLPGIAEAFKRNQLSNLLIVSNNAIGDLAKDEYTVIDSSFNGTYIYWELNEKNEYCL